MAAIRWKDGLGTGHKLVVHYYSGKTRGSRDCSEADLANALAQNRELAAELEEELTGKLRAERQALERVAAGLATVPGDRTVLVDGQKALVEDFEPGTLLLAMRSFEAQRQRLWLEGVVLAHARATGQKVWWLANAGGWDFILTKKPSADLRARSLGCVVRGPHAPLRKEDDGEQRNDGGDGARGGDGDAHGAGGAAPAADDAQEPVQGAEAHGRGVQGPHGA